MSTTLKLTSGQQRVLDAIANLWKRGYAPSMQEIREACGFKSVNAVSDYLEILERLGRISRKPGVHRSIMIAKQ